MASSLLAVLVSGILAALPIASAEYVRAPAIAVSAGSSDGHVRGISRSRLATTLLAQVKPLHPFGVGVIQISSLEEPSAPTSPATVLDASKLAWLHVPKAGTSFANVLVTWGCPALPEDAVVDKSYSNEWGMFVPNFLHVHHSQCAHGLTLGGSGHIPIAKGSTNDWEAHKGHFVAMFRQPEQRTLSGFNHDKHDIQNKSLDLLGYANEIAGCSVRMMNGFYCGEPVKVNDAMVDAAIVRMDQGFAFVGLVEKWSLSVCLFHKMFGGPCHSREFQDVRPGKKHTSLYDTSGLKNFSDSYDGRIYNHASEIFNANLVKHNVTEASCRKTCYINP